ncbi:MULTISPECIES: hypothetical protein [unclassified Motilimonas]|uniref:hypothetical protein n=1 Tax=Motilimonas TaxID=1914248 RepID=UPI001E38AE9C|nr:MULTISPECIES: hypothetical protein [unclassified Motilimonas]MCE0558224.1 hypothetical protein [Motilimonas sp. E26]MDO6526404.1 hypothetical protein [Motilimonas sp. 1_MG-2023]
MNDFEQELKAMEEEAVDETPLPSIEEQRAIVAKLKALEEKGELTPEVMAEHFATYATETNRVKNLAATEEEE